MIAPPDTERVLRIAARALGRHGLAHAYGHCSVRLDAAHFLVCAPRPMALIAPELALADGSIALTLSTPKLVGGIACGVMMLMTRSMMAAMALGMLAFTALRLLPA